MSNKKSDSMKGVADNKSYKDQYHFSDKSFRAKEEAPSINVDPDINHTIKENPYKQNVNIEGDEIVLEPDLSALFLAKGKKHSQGGISVYLKPESFIFSDDKSMALTKEECEQFELSKGGRYSDEKHIPKDYTPAQVIRRNVKPKDYNRLVANIQDVYKDDLAKKSSAMMLGKHIKTLGQVAYLQEKKKQFPDGLPPFSLGSAPVYNTEVRNEIDEQEQYAKYGGTISNPYLPKAQFGVRYRSPKEYLPFKPFVPGQESLGPKKEQPYKDPYTGFVLFDPHAAQQPAQQVNPYSGARSWLPIPRPENMVPGKTVRTVHGIPMVVDNPSSGKFSGVEPDVPYSGVPPYEPISPGIPGVTTPPIKSLGNPTPTATDTTDQSGPKIPDLDANPQGVKRADWQFTPWQKLSQLYNLSKYAMAKRYMPYRSRYNASYIDPYLVNPEQAVQDVKSGVNQQIGSLRTLSPILRNAQAASAYGQSLNVIPGIRSQYDNQNAQIMNQARQYNNQIKNQETLQNMSNDQNYYRESVIGQQNFDNLKSFLGDQYMNELLGDVSTNQSLAYNLLTQNNPAYAYDWRTGNFTRTNKSIMDVQTSNPQADVVSSLLNQLLPKFETFAPQTQVAITKLAMAKGLPLPSGYLQSPPPFKKGGIFTNPYRY